MIKFNIQNFTETTSTLTGEMATFYKTQLVEVAKPQLVFNKFGDIYDIPKGNGKTINIRKYSAFKPATTALTEGATPNAQSHTMTSYNPVLSQYGAYVCEADLLKLTAVDDMVSNDVELLGDQMALTVDTVDRNELVGGTNVAYASTWNGTTETEVSSRSSLDKTAVLTGGMIRKAAAYLKGVNGKTFDGSYICAIHPHVSAALQKDSAWIDASKYATPEQLKSGEIGKLYGVRFYESSNCKIWQDSTCPIIATAFSTSSTYAVGDRVSYSNKVYECKTAITTAGAWDASKWDEKTSGEGFLPVYATLVWAKHAYAVTNLDGEGSRVIVKQLGAGEDPLDQRATVGFKCTHTVKRLGEEFLVRLESTSELIEYSEAN